MVTLLIRTLLIYVFLIFTMRLMGKRQIGELEVTDLVTTLLLSEIAALPITNQELPVSYAIIPMVVLLALEVLSSYILLRFPKLKKILSAQPTVLIQHGKLSQKALRETRITLEELMSEVRQQGLTDLEQVACAILEKNGNLTVLPKAKYKPPCSADLQVHVKEEELMHIVYSNGAYNEVGLRLIGKGQKWLDAQLNRRGLNIRNLFCVTATETGKLYWIGKEEPSES